MSRPADNWHEFRPYFRDYRAAVDCCEAHHCQNQLKADLLRKQFLRETCQELRELDQEEGLDGHHPHGQV
jgi:hypothetical protein